MAAKHLKGECPNCKADVPLALYWVQSGADAWRLRSRCAVCRRELGLVKQTEEALRFAPAKVPQTYFDFGEGPPGGEVAKARETDPT